METSTSLTSAQSPSTTEEITCMWNISYHKAVSSLMYASLRMCPNITYTVQAISHFSKNPGLPHWDAIKWIFHYLKGMKDLWLSYGEKARELTGYADVDGNMAKDRHTISGYAFLLHSGTILWSTKWQKIILLSMIESEYVAATYAAKEALWLWSLLSQLFDTNLEATTLFLDNQSAITLMKDHQYHIHTKYIDIWFHFIQWIVKNGSLQLIYCPTEDMVADALMKALPSLKVKHFTNELGLVSIWGGVLEFPWQIQSELLQPLIQMSYHNIDLICTFRHLSAFRHMFTHHENNLRMFSFSAAHSALPHFLFSLMSLLTSSSFYCLEYIYPLLVVCGTFFIATIYSRTFFLSSLCQLATKILR